MLRLVSILQTVCVGPQLRAYKLDPTHQTVCMGSTTAELMRWRPLAATHRPSATQARTPDRSSSSSEIVYAP